MHLAVGLVLLAQLQALVPIERPEAAAYQIRQLCPAASPRDRERLAALEHRLSDSASAKQVSPDIWRSLGCVRALQALNATLDRNDEIQAPISISQAEGAFTVLIKALDHRPADAQAAELLAALSQQVSEEPAGGKAILLDDLALTIHRAVQAGVSSPSVFRACIRLLIAVGDIATARECSSRAMKFGSDSTWHLLRLARVSLSDGDTTSAVAQFERAALSAHDSSAMNELLYPFFTEANWVRWLAIPDSERGGWLRDSLFPVKLYQLETYRARLSQQLEGGQQGGGRSFYWWCWPSLPAKCGQPAPKGETVIRTAARFNQLWDVTTGAPIAVVTFGVRIGDLESEKDKSDRIAELEVTIHNWDEAAQRWSDTTIHRQLRYPASTSADDFAISRVTIPTSLGVTSWAIRVAQSANRRGRAADDQRAPIGEGPMRLSDLLVGNSSPDSAGKNTGTALAVAPLGHVNSSRSLQLFFQVQSDDDRPQLRLFVVLRRMIGDSVDAAPALQVAFDGAAKRGLNEFFHTFTAARLSPGHYRLQVMVLDEVGGDMGRRETTLLVD